MENLLNEKQLIAEIDHLRTQFTDTQDLYREVCVLLFFRYGMTPTANKLYQLVRKGSMSAPADALAKFWEDLREKSRVRIEHPDLPEALKVATADLAVALWSTAQAQAQDSLASYRTESREAVDFAQAKREAALKELQTIREEQKKLAEELVDARAVIQTLEHQLTAANATQESLQSQLMSAKAEIGAYQARLKEVSQEFTLELEKQRQTLQLADERFRSAENRALMEVDRERVHAVKLQKELDQIRLSTSETIERLQRESRELQTQIGEYRQQVGALQGNLHAVTESRDFGFRELSSERAKLEEMQALLAAAKSEAVNRYLQLTELRQSIEESKSNRISRKAKKPEAA
ncbi:MAG: DNA-binding protein [Pseudomonadota bacterium]